MAKQFQYVDHTGDAPKSFTYMGKVPFRLGEVKQIEDEAMIKKMEGNPHFRLIDEENAPLDLSEMVQGGDEEGTGASGQMLGEDNFAEEEEGTQPVPPAPKKAGRKANKAAA
jgi:hypothetical protein